MGEKSDAVVESREWYLASYAPEGVPTSDHLKLRTVQISLFGDSIPDDHMAVEPLCFSIDPFLRCRMSGHVDGLYSDQFQLNEVISSYGIAKVVRSKDINFKEGDFVVHPFLPIAEYCVVNSRMLRKMDPNIGVSLPDFLTCLGVPGFAAWVCIEVLGEPKEGANVFISAASGGVGMIAGQLAKLRGCRVIGSTGSDDKACLSTQML